MFNLLTSFIFVMNVTLLQFPGQGTAVHQNQRQDLEEVLKSMFFAAHLSPAQPGHSNMAMCLASQRDVNGVED